VEVEGGRANLIPSKGDGGNVPQTHCQGQDGQECDGELLAWIYKWEIMLASPPCVVH